MVKTDEVVHVGMRDEDMSEPKELAGRQPGNLPEIEEERPPLEEKIHINGRIAERAVGEGRMELGLHACTSCLDCVKFTTDWGKIISGRDPTVSRLPAPPGVAIDMKTATIIRKYSTKHGQTEGIPMKRVFIRICIMPVTLVVCGCAFNFPLLQPPAAYEERVIEGEGRAKLLLLDISGIISETGHSGGLKEKPSMVSDIKEALQKAEKDDEIAGVLLRINSPGGTVTASDTILHELLAFKARKRVPVYACIIGMGTSGSYYIASAADEISAQPTAITGSIGVLLMRFNVEGLLTKIGVAERTVKSADKKDFLSPFRPATPEEEKIIQAIIDSLHQRFLEVILARPGNSLTSEELQRLADGRVFTAKQAASARLIDRVGYLDDATAAMKRKLNLVQARVVSYYRPGTYRGSIYSGSPVDAPPAINLININGSGLELLTGAEFMYLWEP
jgi:protease-4